jgi:hypothetical protein
MEAPEFGEKLGSKTQFYGFCVSYNSITPDPEERSQNSGLTQTQPLKFHQPQATTEARSLTKADQGAEAETLGEQQLEPLPQSLWRLRQSFQSLLKIPKSEDFPQLRKMPLFP